MQPLKNVEQQTFIFQFFVKKCVHKRKFRAFPYFCALIRETPPIMLHLHTGNMNECYKNFHTISLYKNTKQMAKRRKIKLAYVYLRMCVCARTYVCNGMHLIFKKENNNSPGAEKRGVNTHIAH